VIADPAARALLNLDVASGHVLEQLETITMTEGLSNTAYNVCGFCAGARRTSARGDCRAMSCIAPTSTRLIDGSCGAGLRSGRGRRSIGGSRSRASPQRDKTLQRLQPPVDALIARYRAKLSGPELIELNRLLERLYEDESERRWVDGRRPVSGRHYVL